MKLKVERLFKSAVLVGVFVAVVAQADDFIFNTKSLVGIEGGYTSFKVESNDPTKPLNEKYNKGMAGLKIGAEGENFRVFLGIDNYFLGGDFDHFFTYGGEVDYMFNFSKYVNFFIGANAGMLDAQISDTSLNVNRKFSDPYYGASGGFNIHFGSGFDLELGGRYLSSEASNIKSNIEYKINDIVMGYMSFIIKYNMD